MSGEEAKQRKRIQASQKRTQARQLESQRTVAQGKKDELDEKIEKLEKAKQQVTTALSSLDSFSSGISSLKGPGSFRGDRKDKYIKKIGDTEKKLKRFSKTHIENKKKIEEKLKQLKEDQQKVSMTIGSLSTRIGSLYSAAAQLDC